MRELLRNHRIATGVTIAFLGAITAFNSIGPLDDIKDDKMSGGGDFIGGKYRAEAWKFDLDRTLFGGDKLYYCGGIDRHQLKLDDQVVDLTQTIAEDNGMTYRKAVTKDISIEGPCNDGQLTDADAKYAFWRD